MKKNNVIITSVVGLLVLVGCCLGCFYLGKKSTSKVDNDIKENKPSMGVVSTNEDQGLNITSPFGNNYGVVVVEGDGTAYFVNNKNVEISKNYNIGTKSLYEFDDGLIELCDESKTCKHEAYKLDLENILGAYVVYFGNGQEMSSVLLLTEDGHVNELFFKVNSDEKVIVELHKDVFTTKKIVTILETQGTYGDSVLLVDSEGKKYSYYGIDA